MSRARSGGAKDAAKIRDIARLSGYSTASVSRALNGRPGVSAATRVAILKVARANDFIGNATAKALSTGRSGRLVITVPRIEAEYFARILSGAADVLHAQGFAIMLETTEYDRVRLRAAFASAARARADGMLLVLPADSAHGIATLAGSSPPLVVIDPVDALPDPLAWVNCSHAAGARVGAEHLVALGHRRIGVVAGERRLLATVERLHGIRTALQAVGSDLDQELIADAKYEHADEGQSAAARLLAHPQPPTAIFALNDLLAIGAMRAAFSAGLAVPGDISVIGFDDHTPSALVTPALTTMRQPLDRMGSMGAELLMRRIEGKSSGGIHVEIPTELVIRNSTAVVR
ncbi:LacI family DNA-binding transcriptional regulator [Nocardia callitridis]|uniref:LacI family DNA-binding transcriptional regulator n=1 Tax=Nocardia callitridis TaxID=648753 RepID=A0ABP9KTA8_9NOCA